MCDMTIHDKTAAPMVAPIGNGGSVVSKAFAASDYRTPPASATEIAAAVVAARFRVSPCIARLVCELAQIGGVMA